MEWMSLNDLRESYLSFFESKGHLRLPSFPLVPHGDKSLLLINSGMAPMKKYFTGEEEPPRHRVTTCQKCIRTPDIDQVGKTARHGTYFEMLGNFSFGDYFKHEAIAWAWEFLTKTIGIPAELLYPSIYEKDDEAFDIWTKEIGISPERVIRLGKADNFWEHGSGPCGPCSEIYFDRGEKYGCGSPDCKPGCDCDRYMEIWNNVFSQFYNDGNGNYTEMVHKNIDTGMGLERLACVIQGVDNLFEVDTVRRILDWVCGKAGVHYGDDAKNDVSIRIITDHIRGSSFMISDGISPSNEGRGYVLRRLLRRACRHGRLLGISGPFLSDLCGVVIEQNKGAYPELAVKEAYIKKVISTEEERFDTTIDSGLSILEDMIKTESAKGSAVLSGADSFRLYDTFGFPLDLTREIAAERRMSVDEAAFASLMQQQRDRARAARADGSSWTSDGIKLFEDTGKTVFTGYTETVTTGASVTALAADGERRESISDGIFMLVADKTPFYGEGGGQTGDTGHISGKGFEADVTDTKKTNGVYIHICELRDGAVGIGDSITLTVCAERRRAIARNHSATHLLQAALREVLGKHVEQAGSYVDAERLRFDFHHFAAMTPDELSRVEQLVNSSILSALPVSKSETDIESAKKMGAMALFGEKYGKTVRVIKMGDVSVELCGGTHLDNTAEAGLFKIISESSAAAGIRRIEATTGLGVLNIIAQRDALIAQVAGEVKAANPADISKRVENIIAEKQSLRRELDAANEKLSKAEMGDLDKNAKQVGAVTLITAKLPIAPDAARAIGDKYKAERPKVVLLIATDANFICAAGKDAVAHGANAGAIVRAAAAICGGKGGGRPDSAMAGIADASKTAEALAAAEGIVSGMLK